MTLVLDTVNCMQRDVCCLEREEDLSFRGATVRFQSEGGTDTSRRGVENGPFSTPVSLISCGIRGTVSCTKFSAARAAHRQG